jgi:metallophosphoesterase superfamily enzyme
MNLQEVKAFLTAKPGYQKIGSFKLSQILSVKESLCYQALSEVRKEFKESRYDNIKQSKNFESLLNKATHQDIFKNAFLKKKEHVKNTVVEIKKSKSGKNVLVIGDLHLPFSLNDYLEHCKDTYRKYNCNEVVFIGDIIDNHASSYHETDPDGYNAGEELKIAIQQVKEWYNAFPKATVIIGNHDRIIMRKAYSSGLSKLWIKGYAEVLGTPGWTFTDSIEIDNVLYIHGEGGTARARVRRDLQSIVQGHLHSQAYIDWCVGAKFKLFGMQVGCGIDHKSYAMAYGKEGPKPAIACGVILKGEIPINIMMNL